MKAPNFFLVGAPKCGTTAMNEYLKQHPDIFIPAVKEIHYFGSDLEFSNPRPSLERYLSFFSGATREPRIGESSVWYLFSKHAAREIRAFSPEARILIMLRNPIEAMYALHSQRIYNGTEDLEDFANALAAENERKSGQRLPRNWDNLMGYGYLEVVHYTKQLRRYFEAFGRERVFVTIYEDFQANPAEVYRAICSFLDVDSSYRPEFKVINANKRPRSERFRDFLRFPPASARALIRPLIPRAHARSMVRKRLKSWNTRYDQRRPIDPTLRMQLETALMPDVEALSELLDRDLTAWCRPSKDSALPVFSHRNS